MNDKEVWEKSLDNGENADRFVTKPSGNAKPLPKKKLFKTAEEKSESKKIENLEKEVKSLNEEVRRLKRALNILNNKKQKTVTVEVEKNENKNR